MLGSSNYGAQVAAHFGLPYCFAWFFTDGRGAAEALKIYQETYQPSELHPEPHAAVCVWALAADTAEEAQHHFTSRAVWRVFRDRGQFTAIETPNVAAGYDFTPAEAANIEKQREDAFVGEPTDVVARIDALAKELSLAEVAVVTWTYDEEVRRRSYAQLAAAAGLT
jgi:luciferase family oxidoreductase group 1